MRNERSWETTRRDEQSTRLQGLEAQRFGGTIARPHTGEEERFSSGAWKGAGEGGRASSRGRRRRTCPPSRHHSQHVDGTMRLPLTPEDCAVGKATVTQSPARRFHLRQPNTDTRWATWRQRSSASWRVLAAVWTAAWWPAVSLASERVAWSKLL